LGSSSLVNSHNIGIDHLNLLVMGGDDRLTSLSQRPVLRDRLKRL